MTAAECRDDLRQEVCLQLFDHREYVSMTMEFRCNLRCVHCMIEDTMHRLAPESAERFEESRMGVGA